MKKILSILLSLFCGLSLVSCNSNINGNINKPIEQPNEQQNIDPSDKRFEIYNLALASGYKGSYEEWLNSIKGDEIELSTSKTHILWKYKSDSRWKELIPFDSLVGSQGSMGPQGEAGLSAYEIYIKYNPYYVGSENDWINDLIDGKLTSQDLYLVDYISNTSTVVSKGQTIILPKTVVVYFKDGRYEQCDVTWENTELLNSNFMGVKQVFGKVNKYSLKATCNLRVLPYITTTTKIDGYINGLLENDKAIVTLYNDNVLETLEVSGNGYYSFEGIPSGEYTLKVEGNGYLSTQSKKIIIDDKINDPSKIYRNVSHNDFDLILVRDKDFYFTWEKESNYNTEVGSNVVIKDEITFIPNKEAISDLGYASILREKYNLFLVNDDLVWSTETINRFYELYESLPVNVTNKQKSVWTLTNSSINNDISFELSNNVYNVKISKDAIVNATPRVAIVNGQKGRYFSRRLYNAMVRFVTNNGYDKDACESILTTNFLTSFNVPDYVSLTKNITNEDETKFQEFLPEEKIQILTMFEEMPVGMHKMKELKYLVRRKTGQSHPIYPSAAAVTWTTANVPYIEFMDVSFSANQGYYHTKRLIIHEKTHMLWEHYFSQSLKDEWCKVGGWYKNPDDPDGWSTTKQTEFVSAYAHQHNPDEDMAESVATYVIDPNLLKSRSINKYNFIKNYIMNGSVYLTQIREDLTFEVYNLNPDYTYPGQIKKIEVSVTGDKFEDKKVKIRMELLEGDGFSGAESIYFRIQPALRDSTQLYDVSLVKVDQKGLIFENIYTIDKYSYSGYWFTDQITIIDAVGNRRFESNTDFNMKIFIDNPLYDDQAPEYIKKSLKLSLENANDPLHPFAQYLNVQFAYKENCYLDNALVRLYCKSSNKSDSIDIRVYYDEIDRVNQKVNMKIYIPEHYPSGLYEISEINLTDKAKNNNFYHVDYGQLDGENNLINIVNSNPDYVGPTLDVNDIKVSAVPSNPQSPNGETFVTLKLKINDDISGLHVGYLRLLDPQGQQHGYWLYPPKYGNGSYYFEGDPTLVNEYTFKVTLPKGSASGTWGIYEIALTDFALNSSVYNFTEIVHFEIIK